MSETTQPRPKTPRPIDVLKEKTGGISPKLKKYVQEQANINRAIRTALRSGAKTVPQIATESRLDGAVVLWHLMAMKRYGEVVEAGVDGCYPSYALKEA